jgi:hypothetical protein
MRNILLAVGAVLVVVILYYVFVRSFEFEVNFKAKTTPGDVIETIRLWNRSLGDAKITEVDSFRRLNQEIVWKDRSYVYSWNFDMVNDSVTNVNIQVSEPDRKVMNKLLVPFTTQPIEEGAAEIATTFYDVLKTHLEITRVEVKGLAQLDSTFCVCTALETDQISKANGMMKDFDLLTTVIERFKLKSAGPPAVRVREWSHNAGSLKFDFCFPITRADSLPAIDSIFFKGFGRQLTIKAEFRGNYITSDRAWYSLIHYASKNGYKINGLPIEYFHDNPNVGMNERNWKAEVYLPIEN